MWKELLYPEIRTGIDDLDIRFHSKNNPKSSQLLALNLFFSIKDIDIAFYKEFLNNQDIYSCDSQFEWIDDNNILRQGGNPSNHDVLLDCGKNKYLIEMKFTEHSDAPCSSSHKNEECNANAMNIDFRKRLRISTSSALPWA